MLVKNPVDFAALFTGDAGSHSALRPIFDPFSAEFIAPVALLLRSEEEKRGEESEATREKLLNDGRCAED